MEVGREAWVCELSGSVVVVNKVNPSSGSVPNLPSRRKRTQRLTIYITQISEMQKHKEEKANTFWLYASVNQSSLHINLPGFMYCISAFLLHRTY